MKAYTFNITEQGAVYPKKNNNKEVITDIVNKSGFSTAVYTYQPAGTA